MTSSLVGSEMCIRDSINADPFSISEVIGAVASLKRGKAPGPDKLESEALKWLDTEALYEVQSLIND
eukprot:9475206-Prorocentrum_lima.AAC.1